MKIFCIAEFRVKFKKLVAAAVMRAMETKTAPEHPSFLKRLAALFKG